MAASCSMRTVAISNMIMVSWFASACGGAAKPAETAAESEDGGASVDIAEAADTTAPADESAGESGSTGTSAIPTECAKGDSPFCVPDKGFVSRLCMDVFPGVALVMFRQGTPWTRGYLTRKTEAWNASGGAAPQGELEFDEEVILLRKRGATGGIQVSGAGGGYDVLRWDGACVTLAEEEVTLSKPPTPKTAKIVWRWIDDELREAMKEDSGVRDAFRSRNRECKGATMGEVSLKCVKADDALGKAVEVYVRGGGQLPTPAKRP